MAPLKSVLVATVLALASTTTAKHGPYIPSDSSYEHPIGTGTGAPYPYPTEYSHHHVGTGSIGSFPTGGGSGPVVSINPGGPIESASSINPGGPSEAAATCPLPTTVTTTTQVTVTVTVPAGGQAGSTIPGGPQYTIPGGSPGGPIGGSASGASTGYAAPSASGGLVKRIEMRGLGGEGRKQRKRGVWAQVREDVLGL